MPWQSQGKKQGKTALVLSLTSHTDHMKTTWIRPTLAAVLSLVLLVAWAAVLWVALTVSTVVLDTLDMIVELAAISP
jgi:hypothetical protein